MPAMTPKEAADALYKLLPRAVTPAVLAEYGIEATEVQALDITREILSLNLFWVSSAIEAHLPRQYQAAVMELVLNSVQHGWSADFGLPFRDWNDYLRESAQRRERYAVLIEEGKSPLAVNAEAAALMEENGLVDYEDQQKLMIFLGDVVPVDAYGSLLEDVG